MFLCIDNYDSFVYNLSSYFEELGQKIQVVKNDCITLKDIKAMRPEGIVISPGPKSPASAGISNEIVNEFKNKIPIMGVCLGHQVIGHACGAAVVKGKRPMHGKVSAIHHNRKGLFRNLPDGYQVTRYHSLVIDESTLPGEYQVDARAGDGAVMAISHKKAPVYGVQFHPEAVLTEYGHQLIGNFVRICKEWGHQHGQKN